ncbi:hypothetical protein D3C73_980480 [compost metagenome]
MKFIFEKKQYAPPENQKGFIYEGSSYVPLRFVSYSLNKAVSWDPDTYTVTIQKPSATELITINEYNLNTLVRDQSNTKTDTSNLTPSKLNVYKEKVTYVFDGKTKSPTDDLPGFIVDGSLYVPMRFFSESVGQKIDWDPVTYTISAAVPVEVKEEPKATTKPSPSPTATPVPSTVPGGGGGGGVVSKPSIESLKSDAESKIAALEESCSSKLKPIFLEYLFADADGKKQKENEGRAVVQACDSSFAQIMDSLEASLINNGYDTSIIQQYKDDYKQRKEDEKAKLPK